MLNIMTLGKGHSKAHFSDVLDDTGLFRLGRVMQRRRFDFASKKCFISSRSDIRGVSRIAALSRMESFAVIVNGF